MSEELKESLLNTEYPKLLDASEDFIFKDAIDKRMDFSKFFNDNLNKSFNRILVDNLKDTNNSIYLIGGSRSWDNLINNYKNKINLGTLEQNSIVPGNYDIFCITNAKKKVNTIINKMCKIFDDIITLCQEQNIDVKYIRNYQEDDDDLFIKKGKNKGSIKCLSNNYYSKEGCVFAPCKAMHLEISGGKYNEKVLIYFELILIEDQTIIHYVRDNIVDNNHNNSLNYLNLKGLYLFSELIISTRIDKEFDIDTYRKNLLNKLIETNPEFNKVNIYYKIIKIYFKIFSNRSNFKEMRIILIKNFVFLSDKHIIDDYNSYLTENFRPYINSFILNTYEKLSLQIPIQNYAIFVVGGDAYRRYIPEVITQTNDIDLKLVYTNKDDYATILNATIKMMSKLIYILYSKKPINLFKSYQINDIVDIEFIPIYTGGQFRLRYIKSDNYTLLSIDYRYKLKININNKSIIVNQEFSLLDVVLYHDAFIHTASIIYDGYIPVASPKYLINDLHVIYDKISKNLYSRFHKNSKDKQRFKNLIVYVKRHTFGNYNKLKRLHDDDIIINSIRKININEQNVAKKLKKNKMQTLETNETNETNETDIKHQQLNIYFKNNVYDNFNKDISNTYAYIFIEKLNKNNELDDEEKVYKIKMKFDDIKMISYNEGLSDITNLLSKVDLNKQNDTDTDTNNDTDTDEDTDNDTVNKMFEML
jgi:hypothetical protein